MPACAVGGGAEADSDFEGAQEIKRLENQLSELDVAEDKAAGGAVDAEEGPDQPPQVM